MGQIIETICRKCGFSNTFSYGGNRLNYLKHYPVPAINIENGMFENVNYIDNKNNPKYRFYSENELKGDNQGNNTLENFNLNLNTVNNYCPKCKNFSFDFRVKYYTD